MSGCWHDLGWDQSGAVKFVMWFWSDGSREEDGISSCKLVAAEASSGHCHVACIYLHKFGLDFEMKETRLLPAELFNELL